MDPATHLLTTTLLLGRAPTTLLAGLAPDLPFYVTYPWWWLGRKRSPVSASSGDQALPLPPAWIQQLHFAAHSLLIVALVAWLLRSRPHLRRRILRAWLLHLALDIPSHSRARMAPRLFWPLSDWAIDGISWSDALHRLLSQRTD